MIGDVIYNLLSNDATVSGLVGTKIYPFMAFENVVYPYIVYEQTNLDPTDTKDGVSTVDVVSFDVEIYTKNPSDLTSISTAVRNVLDRYSGTVESKDIDSIKYVSENGGYDMVDRVYLNVHNYSIRYKKSNLDTITDLAGVKNGDTQIDLSWTNITGNTGYRIERSTDLVTWSFLVNNATDTVTYSNTGLTAGNTYFYRVRAFDSNESAAWSNIVGVSLAAGGSVTYTIKDTDANTLYSGSATGTLDQTIQNASVSNSDASYSTTVLAEGTLNLPDITITKADASTVSYPSVKNVDIRTYKSGIAYQRPILTGQTTSYRTGDDAWNVANNPYSATPSDPAYIARLVNFTTLAENNAFGNTNRFTDDAGGQTYTNAYVIDHLTGLGWTRTIQGTSISWNSAIDTANASTLFSFSDWRIPDAATLQTISHYNSSSGGLSYGIFTELSTGVELWTSTTEPKGTTFAFTLRTNGTASLSNILVGRDKTLATSFYGYFMCRNHY